MKAVTKHISAGNDKSASRPELTRDAVRRALKHTLQSLNQDVVPWHQQLAATPRGSDFDLRRESDRGADVLDSLKATGAILGLHFAGTPQGSIFTPMRKVMSALRFRF